MLQETKSQQVAGNNYTWEQYRAIPRNSYSTLSAFLKDRKAYYKKYILKEKDDDINPYFVYGSLVDSMVFTPAETKLRFYVFSGGEPAPQMQTYCKNLLKRYLQNQNSPKKESIKVLMQYAYDDTKMDSTGEVVAFKKQDFSKTFKRFFAECKEYFRALMLGHMGLNIISLYDYNRAEYAVKSLMNNRVIGSILSLHTNERYTVYKQLVVLYTINGMEMKSMMDLVVVDHFLRKVYVYDLKTSHNVEEFEICFVKFNYYVQLGCYTIAIIHWMQENGYADYTLEPMAFLVVDNQNYMQPMLYHTTIQTLAASLLGFTYNNKKMPGVLQTISDLKWHLSSGVWTMSKGNYKNNGVACIDLKNSNLVDDALSLEVA